MIDTKNTFISGYGPCFTLGNDEALCSYVSAILSCMKLLHSRHLSSRSEYKFSTPLTVARQAAGGYLPSLDMCNAEMEPWRVTQPGDHTSGTSEWAQSSQWLHHDTGTDFWAIVSPAPDTDLWWCLLTSDNDTCGSRDPWDPMSEELEHCDIHK